MNDDSTEKRMAGDYEVIQAVHIGDREVVLGEKPQDETGMKYMCAFCRQNALFAHLHRSSNTPWIRLISLAAHVPHCVFALGNSTQQQSL